MGVGHGLLHVADQRLEPAVKRHIGPRPLAAAGNPERVVGVEPELAADARAVTHATRASATSILAPPMPSTLTWLDHDSAERERMNRVLALFQERSTVDELGLRQDERPEEGPPDPAPDGRLIGSRQEEQEEGEDQEARRHPHVAPSPFSRTFEVLDHPSAHHAASTLR